MRSGKVIRLVRERGFGFIRDAQGQEYFFHRSACDHTAPFDRLTEGDGVQFEQQDAEKGPRCRLVTSEQ
jgi:cold shock CspA family protein